MYCLSTIYIHITYCRHVVSGNIFKRKQKTADVILLRNSLLSLEGKLLEITTTRCQIEAATLLRW